MSIKPPNYTQIPNFVLDSLGTMETPILRVLLVMFRQTIGWQRTSTIRMSLSFISVASGLSKSSVCNAITVLLNNGIIGREDEGGSHTYHLDISQDGREAFPTLSMPVKGKASDAVQKPTPVPSGDTSLVPTCPLRGHLPVPAGDTPPVPSGDTKKETGTKETKERERVPSRKAPKSSPALMAFRKTFVDGYSKAYANHVGSQYQHKGAQDDLAVQRLFSYGESAEAVVALAVECLSRTGFPFDNCVGISGFTAMWNYLLPALKKAGAQLPSTAPIRPPPPPRPYNPEEDMMACMKRRWAIAKEPGFEDATDAVIRAEDLRRENLRVRG